jgi:hypothetical protein
MSEEFIEMVGTPLPVIKFLKSDYEPIPYTDHIRLPKKLDRTAVTVWARYWNRKGIHVDMIGTNDKDQVFEMLREYPGISQEFKQSRLKASAFSRMLNEFAALFQRKLWETEPLPGSIVGDVTIPNEQDIVLANTCTLNRQEISS